MTKLQDNPLKIVTKRILILIILVDIILYLILKDSSIRFIFGSTIGLFSSLFGFYWINYAINKTINLEPTKAALHYRKHQIFRNMFYGLAILISIKSNYIDTFSLALGLLGVRTIIQIDSLLSVLWNFRGKEV